MNQEEFIESVYKYIAIGAAKEAIENLKKPVGRHPNKLAIQKAKDYEKLSDEAKLMCEWVAKDAVDAALFGLLCVFDGLRNINDTINTSQLRLTLRTENETIVLADNTECLGLHELYNSFAK